MPLAEATAAEKSAAFAEISSASSDVEIWHRMGDCGYLDKEGRLWFCGRKAERVQTATGDVFTEPCEHVFRDHPAVARCALIGLGRPGEARPALVVQPKEKLSGSARKTLAGELHANAGRSQPAHYRHRRFFLSSSISRGRAPQRQNHRNTLATWAAKRPHPSRLYEARFGDREEPAFSGAERGTSSRRSRSVSVLARNPAPDLEARGVRVICASTKQRRSRSSRGARAWNGFPRGREGRVWETTRAIFAPPMCSHAGRALWVSQSPRKQTRLHQHSQRRL